MPAMPIAVTWEGKTHDVVAYDYSLVAWEKHCRMKGIPLGTSSISGLSMMSFVGWHAAQWEGLIPADLTYEQFLAGRGYTAAQEERTSDAADPTQPGPGPG